MHDGSPTISVDASLGKRFKKIDFDYEAFDKEADRLGMPLESRSNLSIAIGDRGSGNFYNPNTRTINIEAGARAHKAFVHELQHATDDTNDILKEDTRFKAGNFGRKTAIYSAPVSAMNAGAAWLAPIGVRQELLPINIAITTAVGSIALMYLFGYYRHPLELKARKAEAESMSRIVSAIN